MYISRYVYYINDNDFDHNDKQVPTIHNSSGHLKSHIITMMLLSISDKHCRRRGLVVDKNFLIFMMFDKARSLLKYTIISTVFNRGSEDRFPCLCFVGIPLHFLV